ncbi:hypothetical protein C7271_24395, partial [filamentous cyanobacterium CCP5]
TQVEGFQEQCARNSEKGHRVLITGRTLALQTIESRMPSNLARIEILPMDDELQLQWFDRWGDLIGQDKSHLMDILQSDRLPERVRELAREPLLLYLLAAMHRDGELRLEMFEGAEGAGAKVLIYERTLDWVLTKQRAESYRRQGDTVTARDLNTDITELKPEQLRRVLQEAGLCVVQSGMEFASIRTIEDRLAQDSAAKAFLEEAQKRLATDDTPLRNALAAFYLQSGRQGEGSIEFVHKSFGEFLCAERIANSLIDICQPGRNREYDIEDDAFFWTLYDLLGCHVLTLEIVGYLTALLIKHPEFEPERLHRRLYNFYWCWSEGEFVDAPPENLPQRKMRLLRERTPDREEMLGQRQVEINTGLSVMILLWELHRYGKAHPQDDPKHSKEILSYEIFLEFHPCCQLQDNEITEKSRLLQIIGSSCCLKLYTFAELIGPFFDNANFNRVDLRRADLKGANFRQSVLGEINLSSADLSNANFSGANLSNANLINVNFSDANLSNANLSNANLLKANLSSVDLSNANLFGADLRDATLINAELYKANLNSVNLFRADLRMAVLIGANLRSADLFRADLQSTNFSSADLNGTNFRGAILSGESGSIRWNYCTDWDGSKGLDMAIGVPEDLKRQLGLKD